MKIVFFGATKFSKEILDELLKNNLEIAAIFTIPEEFTISYSEKKVKNYNFADLSVQGKANNIPVYYIDAAENETKTLSYVDVITSIQPDVILVMGWYYMVPKKIRNIAKYGTWGIHASMLPDYAGGAPLVWAIINGEKETGVTLFKLEDGVDDGDIIGQEKIIIEFEDTIKEVYEKVTSASRCLLVNCLKNMDSINYIPQDKSKIKVYPQRRPEDGELDLSKTSIDLYNFIRAQSSPYPGAFIKTVDGKKLIIEKARIQD